MIKKPVSLGLGLFCVFLFFINIVNHRDTFVLAISAMAAVVNIMVGLCG